MQGEENPASFACQLELWKGGRSFRTYQVHRETGYTTRPEQFSLPLLKRGEETPLLRKEIL